MLFPSSKSMRHQSVSVLTATNMRSAIPLPVRCAASENAAAFPTAVSLAANELRGEDGLSLLSLETGELVRDAATDRLTCDLILRAAGYEVYEGWWGE